MKLRGMAKYNEHNKKGGEKDVQFEEMASLCNNDDIVQHHSGK